MTTKLTYKTSIAVFLLCVYAFIATPIQLWHHHNYVANISSDSKEETAISKSDGKTIDSNCQICSHHYSLYADDAPVIFALPFTALATNESFIHHSIPVALPFAFDSRGPPAI